MEELASLEAELASLEEKANNIRKRLNLQPKTNQGSALKPEKISNNEKNLYVHHFLNHTSVYSSCVHNLVLLQFHYKKLCLTGKISQILELHPRHYLASQVR